MADKSPTNGNVLDETQYIFEADRNVDKTEDWGRIPKLESDGYLDAKFLKYPIELDVIESYDGSSVPKAVALTSEGLMLADANGNTAVQKFLGFASGNVTGFTSEWLYQNNTNSGTVSLTIPAGENVILMVFVAKYVSGSSLPSGYTFNGNAMTASGVSQQVSTYAYATMYYINLGTLASPLTADLVRTGGTNISGQSAVAYTATDQSTPIFSSQSVGGNPAGSNPSLAVTGDTKYQNIVICSYGGNPLTITNAGVTSRGGSGGNIGTNIRDLKSLGDITITSSCSGSSGYIAFMLKKTGSPTDTDIVKFGGIVGGFSGLTVGSNYYVSNTAGSISTTAGTATILVGVAISATEILILR